MNINAGQLAEVSKTAAPPGPFKHLVLTRFWFRIAMGRDTGPRPDPAWFENRCKLFETYTLPSVTTQSVQDFTWIIYFDAVTPKECLDRVQAMISPYPNIKIKT